MLRNSEQPTVSEIYWHTVLLWSWIMLAMAPFRASAAAALVACLIASAIYYPLYTHRKQIVRSPLAELLGKFFDYFYNFLESLREDAEYSPWYKAWPKSAVYLVLLLVSSHGGLAIVFAILFVPLFLIHRLIDG